MLFLHCYEHLGLVIMILDRVGYMGLEPTISPFILFLFFFFFFFLNLFFGSVGIRSYIIEKDCNRTGAHPEIKKTKCVKIQR